MTRERMIDEAVRRVVLRGADPHFLKPILRSWDDEVGPNNRALASIRAEFRRIAEREAV